MKYFVKTLVEPTLDYELVLGFREGLSVVRNNFVEKKMGFIDRTGNVVIPVELSDGFTASSKPRVYYGFSEGLSPVLKEGKCGFMNKKGEIVIKPEYDSVYGFNEGIALAEKEGKWGYIDRNGKVLIPFEYEWADQFSEGLAGVKKDGKFGYIDKTGEVAIPFGLEFDYIDIFQEGLARVMTGKGEVQNVQRLENESDEEFSHRALAAIIESTKNERWGFIDRTGKIQIPVDYNGVSRFSEGFAVSFKDGRKCYIDKMGNMPFETPFDSLTNYKEGLAAVKKESKWGFIDRNGEIVIPFEYDLGESGSYFSAGLAVVKINNKWGYIDKHGNAVTPFEYDSAGYVCEGLAVVEKDGKYGIIEINETE